jgi:hypothetical protein
MFLAYMHNLQVFHKFSEYCIMITYAWLNLNLGILFDGNYKPLKVRTDERFE